MKHSISKITGGLLDLHDVCPKDEYLLLAQDDEKAAKILLDAEFERLAAYHVIQAMEKYITSKIYSLVDPKSEAVRQQSRTHSVEDAIDYLLRVFPADALIKQQIRSDLDSYVTKGTRFSVLHNTLRYPYYSAQRDSYSLALVGKNDVEELFRSLEWLKSFLDGLDRFNVA